MLRKLNNYFTTFEKILWIGSLVLITGSAVMFGKDGILSVIASLIGATSLLLLRRINGAMICCSLFSIRTFPCRIGMINCL